MKRSIAPLLGALLCAACEHQPTAFTPASDGACYLMSIGGPAPRSAVIRIVGTTTATDSASRRVLASPYRSDASLAGTWRYAYPSTDATWRRTHPSTDSMYVRIGDNTNGYALWLARITTAAPGIVDIPVWSGGVRVFANTGAFNTTAQLSRTPCRDQAT